MEIKNLKKAAKRILKAIKDEERIILYGDADLDGIASLIILKETIEELGGKITSVYFPNREKEGYGINEKALNYLKKYAPALFISLDCGIGNFKEVKLARKIGFEVIIVDHHQVLEELPEASIIVDPKQKGDKYPFKKLACVGVVYKLAENLLLKTGQDYHKRFLELVALGTISDQMPMIDENKKLVKQGITALDHTQRQGIQALIELTAFKNINLSEVQQKIISPLSSARSYAHLNEIYLFLTENSFAKAEKLASALIKRVEKKREKIRKIYLGVERKLENYQVLIFEGDAKWPLILLGTIASRICHKYQKPVFLYKIQARESQGTVRTPSGIDGVKAMISCKSLLETYGGHALAAGFRIKNKNLKKFKQCLTNYFK